MTDVSCANDKPPRHSLFNVLFISLLENILVGLGDIERTRKTDSIIIIQINKTRLVIGKQTGHLFATVLMRPTKSSISFESDLFFYNSA